jgi:VWFA-related protein
MMKTVSYRPPKVISIRTAAILAIAAFFCRPLFSTTDLQILSFPIGLIIGEHRIEVDLGVTQKPANLYLDGKKVCVVTASDPGCMVDFGPTPHVHLLELIRRGPDGGVAERRQRWFNRPGQEAELAIVLSEPATDGVCSGHLVWLHPEKLDPTWIEVTEDGRAVNTLDDRGSFRVPCRSPDSNQLIAASAIFPDGRRAEAVTSASTFGEESWVTMTAVALSLGDTKKNRIVSAPSVLGKGVILANRAGAQIVFVVDPETGPDFETIKKSPGADYFRGRAAQLVDLSLMEITKLWFVLPDGRLRRAEGRVWMMFRASRTPPEGERRVADAVAASGLVAAAGPRKRAVVLVLSDGQQHDESLFNPAEARAYLSEVGVPLFVFRTGKVRDDGWPAGVKTITMYDLGKALRGIAKQVLSQHVAWYPGARSVPGIAADLPDGIEVAGWSGRHEELDEPGWDEVWAEEALAEEEEEEETPPPTGPFGERIEVSAVRLLVSARDAEGRPITDLTIDELSVTEDGREVAVIGLDPVRTRPGVSEIATPEDDAPTQVESPANGALPVTVYVETGLTGSMDTAPTLRALAQRAELLARLGPVDLVVAGPDGARAVAEGLTDAQQLQTALDELTTLPFSQSAIERIRVEFMRDLKGFSSELTNTKADMPMNANLYSAEALARRAIQEETRLILRSLATMNDWAAAGATGEPRVLIAIGTGFDEQPGEFYRRKIAMLDPSFAAALAGRILDSELGDDVLELGRELAASGFGVYPVATRVSAKRSRAAEFSGADITRSMNQNSANLEVDFLLLDPVGSQRHLAKAGGGRVVGSGGDIEQLVDESSGWYVLTYQVNRVLDGKFHEIRVAG